jgi:hypothetical protein
MKFRVGNYNEMAQLLIAFHIAGDGNALPALPVYLKGRGKRAHCVGA